jgi:hypothetical protein
VDEGQITMTNVLQNFWPAPPGVEDISVSEVETIPPARGLAVAGV